MADVLDPAFVHQPGDLRAGNPELARQAQHGGDLVQADPGRGTVIGQHVEQIAMPVRRVAALVTVPLIAGAVEPRYGNAVHHGSVFEHRQVEAAAVEADEPRFEALEIAEKTLQKLFLVKTRLAAGAQFAQ